MAPVREVSVHTAPGNKYVVNVRFYYTNGKSTLKGQEGSLDGTTEKFMLRDGEYISAIKVCQDKGDANPLLYGIQFVTNTGRETHGNRLHDAKLDGPRDPFEVHKDATQFMGSEPSGKEKREFRAKPGYAITGFKAKSNFYLKMMDITQGKRTLKLADQGAQGVVEGEVVTAQMLKIYHSDFARFDKDSSGAIEEKECKELAAFQSGKKPNNDQWKAWMEMMDLNGDGKITIDEYLDVVLGGGWSVLSTDADTFSVGFMGEWHGKGASKGCIYEMRFKMRAGTAGRALWDGHQASAEEAEAVARQHGEAVISVRGGGLTGDEVPLFGQVHWTPCIKPEHGLPKGWSCPMNDHMRVKGKVTVEGGAAIELWQNTNKADRVSLRGVEHVCGLYSPSTGRLTAAGTHLNDINKQEARLESYDLFVVDGGHGAAGACRGAAAEGQWEHTIGFGSAPLRDSTTAAALSFEDQLKALEESGVLQCVRSKDSMTGRVM